MLRKFFAAALLLLVLGTSSFASDVEVWQDPSLNFKDFKKVFILPVNASLNAGSQLMPARQLRANIHEWAVKGINEALKHGRILVRTVDEVLKDMKFIHGPNVSAEDAEFFKRAADMGYNAFIVIDLSQTFETEHIPETTRTYTVYREVERRDSRGRLIETLRIPEEKTEIVPAHDVTYLYTFCEPKLYSTSDPSGDYEAIVKYSIYREYQGGPVIKVVENITIASMRTLFTKK